MMDLRYPNITGASETAQLMQMRSYLHQLVDQLNMALKDMGGGGAQTYAAAMRQAAEAYGEKNTPANTFNSIKALIIKSADIVNAYYEEINRKLSGVYVAESDFGNYTQEVEQQILENAEGITQLFTDTELLELQVDTYTRETRAYIRTGAVAETADGRPIYGVEIGQADTEDGAGTFKKAARFTSDRLSFFDAADNEVAYISDKKLYISHVQITGTFNHGGFVDEAQSNGSIVTKWIGIGG
ncbi:MAG: hypothetical protein IKV99_00525 [Oscillospiraceae bacterium]|nr:hypothetical protein [Oscillospiraceae bacterium]